MAQVTIEKKKAAAPAPPEKPAAKKAEKPAVEKATRPWRPLELMRRLMSWDPFAAIEPLRGARAKGGFAPDFSIKETKDAFVFTGDIPGVDAKDIEVQVVQNRLRISGHRDEEKEERGDTYYAFERSFGGFTRSFTLPAGIDVDKASADLKDGVLTISVPKIASAKTKDVEVKSS